MATTRKTNAQKLKESELLMEQQLDVPSFGNNGYLHPTIEVKEKKTKEVNNRLENIVLICFIIAFICVAVYCITGLWVVIGPL